MQSTAPTPLSYPPLDSRLAEDCAAVGRPTSEDFDVWEDWMVGVLQAYGECAKRHHETVKLWPARQPGTVKEALAN